MGKNIFQILFITTLLILGSCNISQEEKQEPTYEEIADVVENNDSSFEMLTSEFNAVGTEPFWSFNASGSTLILSEPGDPSIQTTTYSPITITSSGSSVIMTGSWVYAELNVWTCSDGMSETVYDYTSTFNDGTRNYSGCANME